MSLDPVSEVPDWLGGLQIQAFEQESGPSFFMPQYRPRTPTHEDEYQTPELRRKYELVADQRDSAVAERDKLAQDLVKSQAKVLKLKGKKSLLKDRIVELEDRIFELEDRTVELEAKVADVLNRRTKELESERDELIRQLAIQGSKRKAEDSSDSERPAKRQKTKKRAR